MDKKYLVFTPGPSSGGGIHSVVSDHSGYLDKHGVLHEIVVTSGPTFLSKIWRFIVCVFILQRNFFLKKELVCIFHIASGNSFYRKSILIYIANRIFGYKYFVHLHGGMFKEFYSTSSEWLRRSILRVFSNASANIVLSDSWKVWLISVLPSAKIFIVPNSIAVNIDIDIFHVNNLYRDIDILFVGRVEINKGVVDLTNVLKRSYYIDKKIVFAGKVMEDCSKEIFPNNVTLTGQVPRSEINKLMQRAKVLILPSHYEAFPVVILEAMINGAVCVCSDVGSIPEIILNGSNGYVFPVKDCNKMDELLRTALLQQSVDNSIRSAAFELVKNKFILDKNMTLLISIYNCKF